MPFCLPIQHARRQRVAPKLMFGQLSRPSLDSSEFWSRSECAPARISGSTVQTKWIERYREGLTEQQFCHDQRRSCGELNSRWSGWSPACSSRASLNVALKSSSEAFSMTRPRARNLRISDSSGEFHSSPTRPPSFEGAIAIGCKPLCSGQAEEGDKPSVQPNV